MVLSSCESSYRTDRHRIWQRTRTPLRVGCSPTILSLFVVTVGKKGRSGVDVPKNGCERVSERGLTRRDAPFCRMECKRAERVELVRQLRIGAEIVSEFMVAEVARLWSLAMEKTKLWQVRLH